MLQLEAEHAIPADRKFYCPFLECSALMVVTQAVPGQQTPCTQCRRPLCFYCRTKAHPGFTCGEAKVSHLAPRSIADRTWVVVDCACQMCSK